MPVVARQEEVHVGRHEGDEGDEEPGEADAAPLTRHHGDDPPGVGHCGDDVDGPQHPGVAAEAGGVDGRERPQRGVDEHRRVGQEAGVVQQADDAGTRHQVHLRLLQGAQGVPGHAQRVRPLQHSAQVADLLRRPGGPLVQETARAHGDDDAALALTGPVAPRGLDAVGRLQGRNVHEVLAQDVPQQPQSLPGNLTQPQALPVLHGQGQGVPQCPTALVGRQQLLGGGDLGQLRHLGDVETRQVADPVDGRHRPQDLGVQDMAPGDGKLRDGAQSHQVHHGGAGSGSVFGHWEEPKGVGAGCVHPVHPVNRYGSLLARVRGEACLPSRRR